MIRTAIMTHISDNKLNNKTLQIINNHLWQHINNNIVMLNLC